jgi:tRNA(Ile)-lysidine synthase
VQSLEERFTEHIRSSNLFTKEDTLLVAMSGGLDSTVLGTMLHSLGFTVVSAHMAYGLRGDESAQDAKFVAQWCRDRGISFHCYMVEQSDWDGLEGSLQMKARTMRYRWLRSMAVKLECKWVLTAHQADDVAETILMRILRGGGILSLKGIPLQRGIICRPLLPFDREEIRSYALEKGIEWREDSSNQRIIYQRNMLRNEVFPKLEHTFLGARDHILALPQKLEPAMHYLNRAYRSFYRRNVTITEEGMLIKSTELMKAIGREEFLFRLLEPFGFSYEQCRTVLKPPMRVGATWYSAHYRLLADRGQWCVEPIPTTKSQQQKILISGENGSATAFRMDWQWRTVSKAADYKPSTGNEVDLDADLLHEPLELTPWQQGDRIRPLGMDGTQKVSDYLINKKVSLFEKEHILVVRHGSDVVWLVGHTLDHRYRITSATKRIFTISCSSIYPTHLHEATL